MEKSKKYTICIDPQFQAQKWLKAQYASSGLMISKYQDPLLRKGVEVALEMGKPVLVENIGSHVDIAFHSLLKREVLRHSNQRLIKFCRKTFKFDKGFKLMLVSNQAKPEFDERISRIAIILNFSVTLEGL